MTDQVRRDVEVTTTAEMRRVYETLRQENGEAGDDLIIRRGLEFLEEAEHESWPSDDPLGIIKRLAQTRAMYWSLLVDGVELSSRALFLGSPHYYHLAEALLALSGYYGSGDEARPTPVRLMASTYQGHKPGCVEGRGERGFRRWTEPESDGVRAEAYPAGPAAGLRHLSVRHDQHRTSHRVPILRECQ